MIVDTSALIAVMYEEAGHGEILTALETSDLNQISAATWTELMIVADRNLDPADVGRLEQLIAELRIEIVDVGSRQAGLARQAYRDFGKGRHRAGLNFGDCFSYALAKDTGESLLCVGEDFRYTDLMPALPRE